MSALRNAIRYLIREAQAAWYYTGKSVRWSDVALPSEKLDLLEHEVTVSSSPVRARVRSVHPYTGVESQRFVDAVLMFAFVPDDPAVYVSQVIVGGEPVDASAEDVWFDAAAFAAAKKKAEAKHSESTPAEKDGAVAKLVKSFGFEFVTNNDAEAPRWYVPGKLDWIGQRTRSTSSPALVSAICAVYRNQVDELVPVGWVLAKWDVEFGAWQDAVDIYSAKLADELMESAEELRDALEPFGLGLVVRGGSKGAPDANLEGLWKLDSEEMREEHREAREALEELGAVKKGDWRGYYDD